MELQHFSHDHPLILKEERKSDDNSSSDSDLLKVPCCDGCGKQIILGPFYNCEDCDFFLHKSCSELPREIQHPLHPEHPLTLFAKAPYYVPAYNCSACRNNWKHFCYHCSLCGFDLDVECATMTERTIEHPSHIHPLKVMMRPSLSFCDACGIKHEGVFYSCTTCDLYSIHRDCASLPTTFENTDYHHHTLTLAYSLPPQYTTFGYLCEICEKPVNNWLWDYYCGRCRFIVHVNCVTSATEHFMSVILPNKEFYLSQRRNKIPIAPEDSHLEVVHLPLQDQFLSLVGHFHKVIQSRAKEITTYEPPSCHQRPLVLYDDVQGNDTRLDILHDHMKYQKTLCNACIRPTTATPFYKCVYECNSILHKCCAELPHEIQHPLHLEHALVLGVTEDLSWFRCEGCKLTSNGFTYSCADCDYFLDVICATLPTSIKHEAHVTDHLMSLKSKISRHCNACYDTQDKSSFTFRCESCDYELHAACATLPSTVRHRYDETHPYSLTYRPVEDHDSDYCCDICETEINPLWWFYHCVDCDKSMHTWCHPTFDWRSMIKFGCVLTIDSHPHPLNMVPVIPMNTQCNGYVRVITEETICSKCGEDFQVVMPYYPMGFKCLECNYKIHYPCLDKWLKEGLGYNILQGF